MDTGRKYTILIAENSREHMRTLKEYAETTELFSEFYQAHNGKEAMELAAEKKPDLVLCSMILPDIDGIGTVYSIRQLLPESAIVVTALSSNSFSTHTSFANGADMFLIKPCDFRIFNSTIRSILTNRLLLQGTTVTPESDEKRIFTDITREIQHIGVNAGIKGFKYVRSAIFRYMKYDKNPSIMHDIYPAVAREFNTSPACVERNIRHALEGAWIHGSISYIDEVFGFTVDADKGKPTNSAFIATISERVRLRNML